MKHNDDYTTAPISRKIMQKILGAMLILIGIIPIVLSAITHASMDIGGAILTIFIGGCAFVSNEIV